MLDDVRILELGELYAGPYCAKLLADLGAEVVKVEPPRGDEARRRGPFPGDVPHPERSGLFLYLNTNKRGITLDVATASGRAIALRLARWADVLVENLGPPRLRALGLEPERWLEANPRLVVTSLSPFGQDGPYRDYQASDAVSFHVSGYAYHLAGPVDDPNSKPPLKAAGRQAEFVAAVHGALATLAGVMARDASGQGQRVDVSAQEALLHTSFGDVANVVYDGKPQTRRREDNPATGVVAVLPTRDGHVAISPRQDHLWARWLEVMGNPTWAGDPRFATRELRQQNWQHLEPLLAEWTRQHGTDEIFRAAQAARVPAFPVNTMEGIFGWPQLAARAFFQPVGHPAAGSFLYPTAPYAFTAGGWSLRRPAPLLGEHNEEVLCAWLGHTREDLVALRRAGVI